MSHQLSGTTPAYGGGESLNIAFVRNIKEGDSCNTQRWCFSNHLGTHIDFPKHFQRTGSAADDYPPDFWIFNCPFLVDVSPVAPGHIITPECFAFDRLPDESDLIIIKTGFCSQRGEEVYWKNNPGFSPDLAFELRGKFPRLRVVGTDSISISSFVHRDLGRTAHLAFLKHERPILLLEDMNLSDVNESTGFKRVIVSPIRVEGADAAPCTIFAELKT